MQIDTSLRTLIIIPAYNEEDALPGVLRALHATVPQYDVLVVVDGATDRTAAVARAAGVKVAELPFNLGIGGALRTGFQYAARNGYERAVQFDADGQHDPREVMGLIHALDEGAEMVVGSRFHSSSLDFEVGMVRGRAMSLLRLMLLVLSGRRFTDTSSGFRGFSRATIEFFATTYPAEYMESVEALLLACYAGFRVTEVPTTMQHRAGGLPSNRSLKLVYHYLRLTVTMLTSASLRGRRSESTC